MTPKWHRQAADALRAAVDRADTWLNGPDEVAAFTKWLDGPPIEVDITDIDDLGQPRPLFTGADDPDGTQWDGTMTIPTPKVSPNVDHTPPPPIVTHPECAVLALNWSSMQAEADATHMWADNFFSWWANHRGDAYTTWLAATDHLDNKVRDYHAAAARIVGAS